MPVRISSPQSTIVSPQATPVVPPHSSSPASQLLVEVHSNAIGVAPSQASLIGIDSGTALTATGRQAGSLRCMTRITTITYLSILEQGIANARRHAITEILPVSSAPAIPERFLHSRYPVAKFDDLRHLSPSARVQVPVQEPVCTPSCTPSVPLASATKWFVPVMLPLIIPLPSHRHCWMPEPLAETEEPAA